jgi:condensin complex subunit 3
MPAAAFKLETAPGILANALEQSQRTASNHRKNINIVYKLFQQCSLIVEKLANGRGTRLSGEKAFIDTLKENGINRVLVVKRGVTEADRVIRFICAFISHATEQHEAALAGAFLFLSSFAGIVYWQPASYAKDVIDQAKHID